MFKCTDCGFVFAEEDIITWQENYGEFFSGCPQCFGAYEETVECDLCKSDCLENEMNFDICQKCFDEYASDVNFCYKVASEENFYTEMLLNNFLWSFFTAEEIEQILLKELQEKFKNDAKLFKKGFAFDDVNWFSQKIIKYEKEEK